jgi:hypothetical protein
MSSSSRRKRRQRGLSLVTGQCRPLSVVSPVVVHARHRKRAVTSTARLARFARPSAEADGPVVRVVHDLGENLAPNGEPDSLLDEALRPSPLLRHRWRVPSRPGSNRAKAIPLCPAAHRDLGPTGRVRSRPASSLKFAQTVTAATGSLIAQITASGFWGCETGMLAGLFGISNRGPLSEGVYGACGSGLARSHAAPTRWPLRLPAGRTTCAMPRGRPDSTAVCPLRRSQLGWVIASMSCFGSTPSASRAKRTRSAGGSSWRSARAAHDRVRDASVDARRWPVRAGRTWTSTRAAPDRVCAGRGPLGRGGGRSRIRTWEAFATDLQSAPFGRSGNLPGCAVARYAGYDSEEPGSVGGSVGEEALPWQTHRSTW